MHWDGKPKIYQALNISSCLQRLQGQETASSIDRTARLLAGVFLGAFLNLGFRAPQLGSASQPIMPLQPQGRSVCARRNSETRIASSHPHRPDTPA